MPKDRDLNGGDVLPASWTDAIQEFIGNAALGLRLSATSNTVRATAASGAGQVAVGVNGLWRERTTPYDQNIATIGSTPETQDIHVVAPTANSFSGITDSTSRTWELRTTASGGTPGSVAASRKVGEVDWDGTKITALRQTAGFQDATQAIAPVAPTVDSPAGVFKAAASQVSDIVKVLASNGSQLFGIKSDGTLRGNDIVTQANMADNSVGAPELIAASVGRSEIGGILRTSRDLVNATGAIFVTWSTPFADANYTVSFAWDVSAGGTNYITPQIALQTASLLVVGFNGGSVSGYLHSTAIHD